MQIINTHSHSVHSLAAVVQAKNNNTTTSYSMRWNGEEKKKCKNHSKMQCTINASYLINIIISREENLDNEISYTHRSNYFFFLLASLKKAHAYDRSGIK